MTTERPAQAEGNPHQARRAILLAVVLVGLANGGLYPVIGVRLSASGASEFLIGLLMSVYFVGTVLGALTGERIIGRIGHSRAFVVFAATAGITTVLLAYTPVVPGWMLLRVATGYCMGAYYLVVESWLNHIATNANRGRSLAVYETIRMIAVAWSPVLLTLPMGPDVFFLAGLVFTAAVIPVALFGSGEPRFDRSARAGIEWVARLPRLATIGCAGAGLVAGAFNGLGAVYGEKTGLGIAQISLLMSVTWIAPVFVQLPVGLIADRFGRRGMMLAVAAIAALAALAAAALGHGPFWLLLALSFTMWGLSHPVYALGLAYANDRLDPDRFLRAGSLLLLAYSIGAAAGPTAASLAMMLVGPSGLYLFIAAALAAVSLSALASDAAE